TKNTAIPNVHFYHGENGLKTVYYDRLTANEILCICRGSENNLLSDDPEYLQSFITESMLRNIKTRDILQDTPAVREYEKKYNSKNHQIIIIPKSNNGQI